MERDGAEACIFFDVVKTKPLKVIVGSRGREVTERDADVYEAERPICEGSLAEGGRAIFELCQANLA